MWQKWQLHSRWKQIMQSIHPSLTTFMFQILFTTFTIYYLKNKPLDMLLSGFKSPNFVKLFTDMWYFTSNKFIQFDHHINLKYVYIRGLGRSDDNSLVLCIAWVPIIGDSSLGKSIAILKYSMHHALNWLNVFRCIFNCCHHDSRLGLNILKCYIVSNQTLRVV